MAKEKAWKNRFSDKKQYTRYREVLGNKAPRSFTKFQETKYSNDIDFNNLKRDY